MLLSKMAELYTGSWQDGGRDPVEEPAHTSNRTNAAYRERPHWKLGAASATYREPTGWKRARSPSAPALRRGARYELLLALRPGACS